MTLVFIHAFPFDHRMWLPVVTDVESAGLEVVTIDLPGFGGTALPDGPPDLAAVAAEVIPALPQDCVLAGVSLGGYVVMEILRTKGAPVPSGIALCDTKASADTPAAQSNRLAMADLARAYPEEIGQTLITSLLPGLLGREPAPGVTRQVETWLREAPASAVAWYQCAMAARPDSHGDLANFDGPSLVLWGDQDALSPSVEQESMLGVLSDPTNVCIPEAGHLACVEDPGLTAQALIEWIRLRGIG